MKRFTKLIFIIPLVLCLLTGCGNSNYNISGVEDAISQASDIVDNNLEGLGDTIQEITDEIEEEIAEDESDSTSSSSAETVIVDETASTTVNGTMEVHFIDVGQGDATLIINGEHAILIDAGENDKGTLVQNYLEKQGVEKLDMFVVTHFDSDHCGGADVIITKFDIDTLLMSDFTKDTATCRDVLDAAEYKSLSYTTPFAGNTYTIGDMEITIVAPAYSDYSDANNSSIGLIVKYGNTSFLFTGDCEEDAEAAIVASGISLDVDVYKCGHHGSKTSSSTALLEAASPTYAVISCGEGNDYGHPHAATLNNLRSMGVEVFRTDEQGSIVATSDGNNITWNCAPSETWQTGDQTVSDQEDLSETTTTTDDDSDATYVGNSNSMKFHYSWCESVEKMAEKNKVDLSEYSREEIIEMGYTACGSCNP